jgi:hypothetical protein
MNMMRNQLICTNTAEAIAVVRQAGFTVTPSPTALTPVFSNPSKGEKEQYLIDENDRWHFGQRGRQYESDSDIDDEVSDYNFGAICRPKLTYQNSPNGKYVIVDPQRVVIAKNEAQLILLDEMHVLPFSQALATQKKLIDSYIGDIN